MNNKTEIFMKKQCAENRARMAREANGDYGTPIHVVADENRATHKFVDGQIVPKGKKK